LLWAGGTLECNKPASIIEESAALFWEAICPTRKELKFETLAPQFVATWVVFSQSIQWDLMPYRTWYDTKWTCKGLKPQLTKLEILVIFSQWVCSPGGGLKLWGLIFY
jgi:hypothetical protein